MVKIGGFWQNRRVFVTGPTGLIGSWLVKALLDEGASVTVLIHAADARSELYRSGNIERVSVVNGALEDFFVLERAISQYEVDAVFHLGAQALVGTARRSPMSTLETNVRGTYNLLEACRLHPGLVSRIVIATSDKVYGEQPHLPCTEETQPNSRFPYEVSKRCAELVAQTYCSTYGLPVALLRCANVYGGGDLNWSRIVPATIRSLLQEDRPVIRSDGSYVRDYIYVRDIACAFMRVAECLDDKSLWGEVFNLSTETSITVLEMVDAIRKLMDRVQLAPDVRNSSTGEIQLQHMSAQKARDILKWKPRFDLESGLRETVGWYMSFFGVDGNDVKGSGVFTNSIEPP
jgi:CDP-glucose 4,6-dehydratase